MEMPFKEIVDLSHELYTGMPNIGGLPVQFWPLYNHRKYETLSGGKVSMEMSPLGTRPVPWQYRFEQTPLPLYSPAALRPPEKSTSETPGVLSPTKR